MRKIIDKLKTLKLRTIIFTIIQFLAYVNQVIAVLGQSSWASMAWYQWTSLIVTILITILTYWYNNDWSKLAQSTGDIYDMVKDGEITQTELEDFIKKHEKEEKRE